MIILDLISIFIEDFILSFTIVNFFKVKRHKEIKCIFLTLLCMIETFYFNYIIAKKDFLAIILCLTQFLYLVIEKKKLSLLYLITSLTTVLVISTCNALSLFAISTVFNKGGQSIPDNTNLFILSIIVSRISMILACFLFLRIAKKGNPVLSLKKYWTYLSFSFMVVSMFTTLSESIVYQTLSLEIIYILLAELVALSIFGVLLFIYIYKQEEENFDYSRRLMENEYQRKLSCLVQNSLTKISSDKHMMMYTLLKIKQQLKLKNNQELENLINIELNKYLNYKFISSTENYLFDYEMTIKIQELSNLGYDIKALFSINEKNNILNENEVVFYLLSCIDILVNYYRETKTIQLFIDEQNSYLVFKIVFSDIANDKRNTVTLSSPFLLKKQDVHWFDNQVEYIFLFR